MTATRRRIAEDLAALAVPIVACVALGIAINLAVARRNAELIEATPAVTHATPSHHAEPQP